MLVFVMYYIYVTSGSSLLIESTDSMIIAGKIRLNGGGSKNLARGFHSWYVMLVCQSHFGMCNNRCGNFHYIVIAWHNECAHHHERDLRRPLPYAHDIMLLRGAGACEYH